MPRGLPALLFFRLDHDFLFLTFCSSACMVSSSTYTYHHHPPLIIPPSNYHFSAWKQRERQSTIDSLPAVYSTPLSFSEEKLHALSLSQLVSQCRSGSTSPAAIMLAYAKKTLVAHKATNCVSEFMFQESLVIPSVANWGPGVDSTNDSNSERSLLGVPVSIKGIVYYPCRCIIISLD